MQQRIRSYLKITFPFMCLASYALLAGCPSTQRTTSGLSEILDFGSSLINEEGNPLGLISWIGGLTLLGGLVALCFSRSTGGTMALLIGAGILIVNFTLARTGDWMFVPILLAVAALGGLYTYEVVRKRRSPTLPASQDAALHQPADVDPSSASMADAPKTQLARQVPKWLVIVVSLLLPTSLVLNIIALLPAVAFIEISGVIMAGPYSILGVIHLLWEHGLYPLAILIIGFSVLFPPIKISLATWAFLRPMTAPGRQRLLGTLGQLGRWSLLDVFVALLLMIIMSKQTFTGTTVNFGLYAFLGAICLSMTAVALMQEFNRSLHRSAPRAPKLQLKWARPMLLQAGPMAWTMLPLLAVAIMCLEMAVNLPLFQIDRFGLMSNTWSLWSSIAELQAEDLHFFAAVMFFFLIIAPAILVFIAIMVLLLPIQQKQQRWLYVAMHNASEWCMLDVFALAMVLYLSEERNFAHLDLKAGLWYLFGSMGLFHLVIYAMVYLVRRETDLSHH